MQNIIPGKAETNSLGLEDLEVQKTSIKIFDGSILKVQLLDTRKVEFTRLLAFSKPPI